MTFEELNQQYDILQKRYGDTDLRSIYYGGCMEKPDICFVFMNPTGRNIASRPEWTGIRAPWVGTKNIWDLFHLLGKLDEGLYQEIKNRKAGDWMPEFADQVYREVAKNRMYLTNLGKCTLSDAQPVSNAVYRAYLPLLENEIALVDPKAIVMFGNQVSSVFLGSPISVSKCRRAVFHQTIHNQDYPCYPVYYPVGNGRSNLGKAVEDIAWLIRKLESE